MTILFVGAELSLDENKKIINNKKRIAFHFESSFLFLFSILTVERIYFCNKF